MLLIAILFRHQTESYYIFSLFKKKLSIELLVAAKNEDDLSFFQSVQLVKINTVWCQLK